MVYKYLALSLMMQFSRISGKHGKKWLTAILFTSLVRMLFLYSDARNVHVACIFQYITFFRAQEPKAPVTYCDHALSGVRPSSVIR